jgi:hypothetical protein
MKICHPSSRSVLLPIIPLDIDEVGADEGESREARRL